MFICLEILLEILYICGVTQPAAKILETSVPYLGLMAYQ